MAWSPPASDAVAAFTPPPGDAETDEGMVGRAAGAVKHKLGELWDALLSGAKALPGEPAREAQANAGKSLSQRALDPQGMQTAMQVAMGSGGVMSPMARAGLPLAGVGSRVAPGLQTPAQSLLQDFKKTGVTPSVPTIGQGRAAGLTAQVTRNLPFSPTGQMLKRNLGETQQEVERQAGGLGRAATPEEAGNVQQNAMKRFAADRSEAGRNFGQFFHAMTGSPPIPLTNTAKLLTQIEGRFPSAPGLKGIFTSPKLQQLSSIVQKTSGLTVPELKEFRSQVGYMLENPTPNGPEAIPKAQLRSLYGALTKDMQAAAQKQGPAAVRALTKATMSYGMRMRTIERLQPLLNATSPEQSFARLNRAAQSSGTADANLLATAKNVLDPQEWGDIGSTFIRQMGKPTPGAGAADDFSLSSYATNWNKLSGHAKDLLFGPDIPGSPRSGLETLSRVVGAQKNVGRLSNVSHSGDVGMTALVLDGVFQAIGRGQVPWAQAAGVGGAYGISKLLMSPGFTSWLYGLPRAARGATTPATAVSRGLASLQAQLQNPSATPPQPQEKPATPPPAREPRTSVTGP